MTAAPFDTDCILLTGASSGIGREIAIALSKRHRVLLNGRDLNRLEETRLACAHPKRQFIWPCDLADTSMLERSFAELLATRRIRIVGFVHCAGFFKALPLRNIGADHALEVMTVNLLSAIELVRVLMRRPINGAALRSVVFISSIASQFGAKGFSAYCASKAGLDGLMRALAVELAPAVRVNSVLPGAIRTPMTEGMYADSAMSGRLTRDYPLGAGLPTDISDAVGFLLSDQARWVTGHQLVVDGGRTVNISS